MWQYQQQLTSDEVTRTQIWAAWSDVSAWPNWWNKSLKSAACLGEFANHASLTMQTKYWIVSKATLLAVKDQCEFTVRSSLPGMTLDMQHHVFETDTGTTIVYQPTLYGPLAFLYRWVIGTMLRLELPSVLPQLVTYAKQLR